MIQQIHRVYFIKDGNPQGKGNIKPVVGVYLHSAALHLFPEKLWRLVGTAYDMHRTHQTLFCCVGATHARTKLELAVVMWLWVSTFG